MFGRVEELVVVLIIVLVLFGGKKLPEFSRGIAQSIKEVRKGFRDDPEPQAQPSVATAEAAPAQPTNSQTKV